MDNKPNQIKLRKRDLIFHWLLGYSNETCYNYERLQALGTTAAMYPIIKRLYKSKEDISKALKRYLVFFNTEPSFIGTIIHGICASMEEQRANGANITDEDTNALRTGLMGPMAGIGDTVSQGLVYPILAGIACSLALQGNVMGPIFFEIAYKVIMLTMGYNMYMLGYRRGKSVILEILKSGTLSKLTDAFSIIGLMVVGAMTSQRVNVVVPLSFKVGQVSLNIQKILDSLLPGLVPLAITLIVWQLIRKKVKPIYVILLLFVLGIVASYLNILGVPKA
ncbi:PTS system mannose/fructose/sorbose family IID component [Thermoanaerobacterium thermosaccharolyticum DSM 571]|uniref:PTS system mannose/fructose/sorbose family IID component n=1 Tax=Thermoanaerobacterium thermosaccharolyticum (strain ATCC 7956 / DSM 571 / NCIMB 9385 / NCA 3814 / NCTC 13789 / WDCM 00135 / 2032) TaxID=580327 RepID=D9TQJ6_THETC|nr:PTS system mannose/fructose/sorbose family transporter subunit IID [Thermoanaerobacterium thermosaccharolyticum]ADL69230.1 PTS system mannose/fructose/sorbose family IID component [Thermoanaerobacterium thermosaccharolyticum DSM 571]TCW31998.1 PTS system mannose-specific IID component [Thermohydrogenium kirishiense]